MIKSMESLHIKGFLENSMLDWWGKLVAVLFLPGCNFRCPYCHNPALVLNPQDLPDIPLEHIFSRLAKSGGWIDGVVITGGEPTLSTDLPQLIRQIRKAGFPVKLDTNGSNPVMLTQLLEEGLLDYVALDVKAPLNELDYQRATGQGSKVADIAESINLLKNSGIDYELRTTVCPSLLDEAKLKQLLVQIKGAKRLVLQNFKPSKLINPDYEDIKPYSKEYIQELGKMSEEYVGELRLVA